MSAATAISSTTSVPSGHDSSTSTERDSDTRSGSGSGNGSNAASTSNKRSFFNFRRNKREKEKDKPKDASSSTDDGSLGSPARIVSDKPPQLPQLSAMPPINTSPPASDYDAPQRSPASVSAITRLSAARPQSPPTSPPRSLASSSPPPHARPATATTASPPRLSTSSSMIFERNVQEQAGGAPPPSSAIPAHIQTENMIPPVLEAASTAITDRDCGVDEVEIVTHSMHQPAVSVVAPASISSPSNPTSPVLETSQPNRASRHGSPPSAPSITESLTSATTSAEDVSLNGAASQSTAAAAAAADKRRLSFISFADVVQAEQADPQIPPGTPPPANRSPSRGSPVQSAVDPISIATISEQLRRSPSPIRGGALGSSPPKASLPGSFSSRGEGFGGPSGSPPGSERGELMVETMRQALRKTGSGEFGVSRSPVSSGGSEKMFGSPLRGKEED